MSITSSTPTGFFCVLGVLSRSSQYCCHQITHFLLPFALCACTYISPDGMSPHPSHSNIHVHTYVHTGHQVWSILASGLTAARGGGVGTCLAVTVCSCVCSWGRRLCYQQVLSRCQESRLVQFSWQPAPTLCRRLERSDPRPIMAKYQGHKMKQAHLTNCRAAALKCRIYVSLNPGQLSRAHRLKCGAVWA